MRWLSALVTRRPLAADAVVAALTAAVNLATAVEAGLGALGWAGFVACHVPLVWRRRAPVMVFGASLALALACWATVPVDAAFPVVVLLVAVYTVARHRSWAWLVPCVAAMAAVFAASWLSGESDWRDAALLGAVLAATVLLGLLLRLWSAFRTQRAERRRQRARLVLAAERSRIAAELHDIVSHNVSVMVALADGAGLTAEQSPQRAASTLRTIADSGRQCMGELHRLLAVLHDADRPMADGPLAQPEPEPQLSGGELSPQPSLAELPALVERLRATGLRIELRQDSGSAELEPGTERRDSGAAEPRPSAERWQDSGAAEPGPSAERRRDGGSAGLGPGTERRDSESAGLGAGLELAVYRIVQEALTNTLNHAGPQATVNVHVRCGAGEVELRVTDDGGAKAERSRQRSGDGGGCGLAGMRDRAAAYGGELAAGPLPDGGWQVHARLRSGT